MMAEDAKLVAYEPSDRAAVLIDDFRDVSKEIRATRDRLKDAGMELD